MSKKRKKKPISEEPSPVPATPDPPHVQEALARFREHYAKAPPGLSISTGDQGQLIIDMDPPGQKHGIALLMDAMGTRDIKFFNSILTQIINATATKDGTDATAVNSALGFIRGVRPNDELEAALAAQMLATHNAVMTFARRLNNVGNIAQQDSAINGFNKLTRSFCTQMEALKRYRSNGEQRVTVQHVTVSDGGQAIVGNVTAGGGGGKKDGSTS